MQILSATLGSWKKAESPVDEKPDPAEQEARRILSEIFRCNNLVVIAGLGTSLCVKDSVSGQILAPTMSDLWTSVRQLHEILGPLSWDELLKLVRQPAGNQNLEHLLSQCRLAESFLDGEDLKHVQNFINLAEGDIRSKVSFVTTGQSLPIHLEFLRRVARRSNRKFRAKIFTTNYDRCFEEAARQGRYVVIDGFSQTQPATFDSIHFSYDIVRRNRDGDAADFIPNVFHLYKVHGSVDWERESSTGEIYKAKNPKNPLLIYPRSSKYELAFAQPYLEMMSALQAALREPNTGLLVVGFGFNDNHLAEPILSAIRSNLALKVAIASPRLAPITLPVPPGSPPSIPMPGEALVNPHLKKIQDLITGGDARLAMLHCGFSDIVPYIPDIAAETDLEKHLDRVRKLEAK